jgi:hypothetical protein
MWFAVVFGDLRRFAKVYADAGFSIYADLRRFIVVL